MSRETEIATEYTQDREERAVSGRKVRVRLFRLRTSCPNMCWIEIRARNQNRIAPKMCLVTNKIGISSPAKQNFFFFFAVLDRLCSSKPGLVSKSRQRRDEVHCGYNHTCIWRHFSAKFEQDHIASNGRGEDRRRRRRRGRRKKIMSSRHLETIRAPNKH